MKVLLSRSCESGELMQDNAFSSLKGKIGQGQHLTATVPLQVHVAKRE